MSPSLGDGFCPRTLREGDQGMRVRRCPWLRRPQPPGGARAGPGEGPRCCEPPQAARHWTGMSPCGTRTATRNGTGLSLAGPRTPPWRGGGADRDGVGTVTVPCACALPPRQAPWVTSHRRLAGRGRARMRGAGPLPALHSNMAAAAAGGPEGCSRRRVAGAGPAERLRPTSAAGRLSVNVWPAGTRQRPWQLGGVRLGACEVGSPRGRQGVRPYLPALRQPTGSPPGSGSVRHPG